jgi:hypothetical protein
MKHEANGNNTGFWTEVRLIAAHARRVWQLISGRDRLVLIVALVMMTARSNHMRFKK